MSEPCPNFGGEPAVKASEPELSRMHSAEGPGVALDVTVRAGLRKRLQRIAAREDRSLSYVVDAGAGSLHPLLMCQRCFSNELQEADARALKEAVAD